jgi:hypothetical protein
VVYIDSRQGIVDSFLPRRALDASESVHFCREIRQFLLGSFTKGNVRTSIDTGRL